MINRPAMHRFHTRKYQLLLTVLLLTVIVYPMLRSTEDSRLAFDFLLTLVFAASLVLIFDDRRHRTVGFLLGVPTMVGLWTGYLLPGMPPRELAVAFHVVSTLFFTFTIGIIVRNIHRETGITADSIYGAICGYLLTGLAFGHIYCLIDSLVPNAFTGAAIQLAGSEGRHFLLTYFSFVTLTTVGYGDIVPTSNTARGLAIVESITGQFYMAVLVAELIGKRVSQSLLSGRE